MLHLALSCLQGRTVENAVDELLALQPDGIQLTPGNVPGINDREALGNTPTRTHHGFSWNRMKQRVWSADGELLVKADSVHPPKGGPWRRSPGQTYEVMYGPYWLGIGADVDRAIDDGLTLAVDVSHVFIQLQQGTMLNTTWWRLQDYERISEVHVSANDGTHDSHRPLMLNSFGLDWARGRGVPLVLECYMHRLSVDERKRQLDIVRGS